MKNFLSQRGQSLLEVVFATTIVAMVLTAIAASMTMSLKTASESKYKGFASYVSQDSQEFFHRERAKLGWAEFKEILTQITTTVCMNSSPDDLEDLLAFSSSCSVGLGFQGLNNEFYREVWFEFPEEDVIVITTKITWFEGDREKTSELKTVFKDNF